MSTNQYSFEEALYDPAGTLWLAEYSETGENHFVELGDVNFTLGGNANEVTFKTRRKGKRFIRKSITTETEINGTLECYDYNKQVLDAFLNGQTSDVSQASGSVTDETFEIVFDKYIELPHRSISNLVVTYNDGTNDVQIPAENIKVLEDLGMFMITEFSGGPAAGDTGKRSYDYAAVTFRRTQIETADDRRYVLLFETSADVDGPRFRVKFHKVKVTKGGNITWTGDTPFQPVSLNVVMEAITPDSAEESEFGVVERID